MHCKSRKDIDLDVCASVGSASECMNVSVKQPAGLGCFWVAVVIASP